MNAFAPSLLAAIPDGAPAELPIAALIAIPVIGFILGGILLTRYAEHTTRRGQNRARREYRFKVNDHETGREHTPPRAASSAGARRSPASHAEYAGRSTARETVREALTEARAAMNAAPAPAPQPQPPPMPMPLREPKRLTPAAPKPVPAGKVELAPTGFWIGAGTAPDGAIIVYRWHDGAKRHDGRVTFAPEAATGGHYVHTGVKPIQVTLVGFEAPR